VEQRAADRQVEAPQLLKKSVSFREDKETAELRKRLDDMQVLSSPPPLALQSFGHNARH
jgi:hypothetical protein